MYKKYKKIILAVVLIICSVQFIDAMNKTLGDEIKALSQEPYLTKKFTINNQQDIMSLNKADQVSLLNSASYEGSFNIVKILLEQSVDPNSKKTFMSKNAPLHEASYRGHLPIIKLLIDYGVDINVLNKYKETPLLHAVLGKSADATKILVQSGTDVNKICTIREGIVDVQKSAFSKARFCERNFI